MEQVELKFAFTVICQSPPVIRGFYGSSIYIHSNNTFPARRLNELLEGSKSKLNDNNNNYLNMEYVQVMLVDTSREILNTIDSIRLMCINASNTCRNVRLIVIESIVSIFQCEFNNTRHDIDKRSNFFFNILVKLREIVRNFNIVLIITNETRDKFHGTTFTTNNVTLTSATNRPIQHALELAWKNCISNRFFVGYKNDNRMFKVIFSPNLPNNECNFNIHSSGIMNE